MLKYYKFLMVRFDGKYILHNKELKDYFPQLHLELAQSHSSQTVKYTEQSARLIF